MKYVLANFKNNNISNEYIKKLENIDTCNNIIIFPNNDDLKNIKTNLILGKQNISLDEEINYKYVILGHYDYRNVDNIEIINKKINKCINNNINVVLCVNDINELDKYFIDVYDKNNIIIAYEPSDYIGTGNIIGKKYIEEFIDLARVKYGDIKIIYGGGVGVNNIDILKNINGLDGILVGSSSLNINSFIKIIKNYK